MNLELETHEKEKPIILISGEKSPLIPLLLKGYEKNFKVAYISNRQDYPIKRDENFYRIKPESSSLIRNLEEKIDYAVIFLEKKNDTNFIPPIFEKLIEDGTKIALILDIYDLGDFYEVLLEYKNLKNIYFLFLGDVYAELPNLNPGSRVAKIIKNAIKNKSLFLSGNDLDPIFPIYYKDAVAGVNQIIFGPPKKQKFYYLFYSHPQTYISAIHVIKRAEPDLDISYREEDKNGDKKTEKSFGSIQKEIQSRIATVPAFLDKYFLGFEKSLSFFQKETEEDTQEQKTVFTKMNFSKKNQIKFFIKALVFAVILFLVINAGFAALGIFELKNSFAAFKKNDYKIASEAITRAKLYFDIAEPILVIATEASQQVGIKDSKVDFETLRSSVSLLNTASKNIEILKTMSLKIDRERLDRLIYDSIYLYFTAQDLKNGLKNRDFEKIITPYFSKMLSLSQVAPEILGFDKEKNYLLLFQNNGELRPTGGFIGSIGELKIRSGKIEEFKIQDVYDYDGKLKAHIEPHYIVRRYLQPHLYLRDSNFDYDFQRSASMSALLYNLETGKTVDGIIAVNFEAIRRIIAEIGPIKLAAYNKTLDEKNAFEFLQNTIDDNFFPGSSQKREVLGSLLNQLTLKIEEDKNSLGRVAMLVPILMSDKNILVSFNKKIVQNIFSANGIAGEYRDSRTVETQDTFADFLAISEANIGVNKANASVNRDTEYEVVLEKKVKSKITHKINNSSDKNYKAYVRLIAPLKSNLASIKIDGIEQKIAKAVIDFKIYEDKKFKAPEGLEVDEVIEGGKKVFGFIVNVSPEKEQKIEIYYDNGDAPIPASILNYSLLFIKQPGIAIHPLTIKVKPDKNYAPKEVENAQLEENSIVILEKVVSDREFKMKFIKK